METFFDVTLACDDAQFRAHKALLAACSQDFFLKILRQSPHEYPYIYLKGVKSDILLSVLNFVYNGEVELSVDQIDSFFEVAEDLSIKGLTELEFRNNGFKRHEIIHLVKTSSKSKNWRTKKKVHKVRSKKNVKRKKGSKTVGRTTCQPSKISTKPVDINDNWLSSDCLKEKSTVESDKFKFTECCDVPEDGSSLIECEKFKQTKSDHDKSKKGKEYLPQKKAKWEVLTAGGAPVREAADLYQFAKHDMIDGKYICQLCGLYYCRRKCLIINHIEDEHFHYLFEYPCTLCISILGSENAFSKHMTKFHVVSPVEPM